MRDILKFCVRTLSGHWSSVWEVHVRHNAVYLFCEDKAIDGWHVSFHSDGRNHMKITSNKKNEFNKPMVRWDTGRIENFMGQRVVIGLVLAFDVGSFPRVTTRKNCEVIDAPDRGTFLLNFMFSNAGDKPVQCREEDRIVFDKLMKGRKRFHLLAQHVGVEEPDLMMTGGQPIRLTNGSEAQKNYLNVTLGPIVNDGVAHLYERWGHVAPKS